MKTLELTLLYLVRDNQVLLAMKKRGFGEGKWNGVGGKIENNESVEEALVRECQEEIGVIPTDFEKTGYLIFNEYHNGERKLMNLHVFVARSWNGKIIESEEMKPVWFAQDKVPFEQMWSADRIWLPKVLSGEKIQGEFTLNEDNSVSESKIIAVEEM